MDTTGTPATSPAPPPPPPRRLTRSRSDRVLTGVCGGIAAHLGVDATLVRLVFVLLTLFGGLGLLVYPAAWLLVPDGDAERSVGAQLWSSASGERSTGANVALLVVLLVIGLPVAALIVLPLLLGASAAVALLVPLLVLAALGLGVGWLVVAQRPDREPRALAKVAAVGVGILVLAGLAGVGGFALAGFGATWVAVAAGALAGVALLVGAFTRHARWLVLPAAALSLGALVPAALDMDLRGGFGERTYAPATAQALDDRYKLGAGELVVDLRDLRLARGEQRRVAFDLGAGDARLYVPRGVCVTTAQASVGAGATEWFGREQGGADVEVADAPSDGVRSRAAATIVVDAHVGAGRLFVGARPPLDRVGGGPRDDWDRPRLSAAQRATLDADRATARRACGLEA